jgi:hypothetical protein
VTHLHRHQAGARERVRRFALLVLALNGMACEPKGASPAAGTSAAAATASSPIAAAPSAAASAKPVKTDRADRTHRAGRCGECHEKMHEEWTESAHARADDSALFLALRAQGSGCERCHAPLELLKEPAAFASKEGVTCEVCHRIDQVELARPLARMELLKPHEVKIGPRCDVGNPYFHRTRCSPLFKQAELCGACHSLHQPVGTGEFLPIHTEYDDFKRTTYAAQGKVCQTCHMPGSRAEVAVGEGEREGVPDHGFLGEGGKLRGSALLGKARVTWRPGRTTVALELKNARAGHHVPAGSPGRQLVVAVTLLAEDGAEVGRAERVFERTLVDDAGTPKPFYAATRVGRDTRLKAGETKRETLDFTEPNVHEVRVTVAFRPASPDLTRALGIPQPAVLPVLRAAVPFGSTKSGSRSAQLSR